MGFDFHEKTEGVSEWVLIFTKKRGVWANGSWFSRKNEGCELMGLDFYEKTRDVSELISILDAKARGVSESISEKLKNVGA